MRLRMLSCVVVRALFHLIALLRTPAECGSRALTGLLLLLLLWRWNYWFTSLSCPLATYHLRLLFGIEAGKVGSFSSESPWFSSKLDYKRGVLRMLYYLHTQLLYVVPYWCMEQCLVRCVMLSRTGWWCCLVMYMQVDKHFYRKTLTHQSRVDDRLPIREA